MKIKKKVKALIEAEVIIIENQNGEKELTEVTEIIELVEVIKEISIISQF